MAKRTRKPPRSTPEPAEAAGGVLPEDSLRLKEYAVRAFREYLSSYLDEQSSGTRTDSDWTALIASGSLVSVLRMIEEGAECPLSAAEFAKIVGESSFKGLIGAAEPVDQESAGTDAENWESRNQRRLALIRKSLAETLTPEEQSELRQLQDEVDKRLESCDDRLLDELQRMKKAVEQLPEGP